MADETPKVMNGYKVFYGNKQMDVYAPTLLEARNQAADYWKVKVRNRYLVTAVLCETNVDMETLKGDQVTHIADM